MTPPNKKSIEGSEIGNLEGQHNKPDVQEQHLSVEFDAIRGRGALLVKGLEQKKSGNWVDDWEYQSDQWKNATEKKEVDEIMSNLPVLFQNVLAPFNEAGEKLMMMTALITLTGCLMPLAYFNYSGRKTHLQLMLMVTAPPSSGKGVLAYLKRLVLPIDRELLKIRAEAMTQYNEIKEEAKAKKKAKKLSLPPLPPPPQSVMLSVPGNITSAALIAQLSANGPNNAIFMLELEADAYGLTASRGEHGMQNSNILRSMFHNEEVSQYRKTDRELLIAESPKGGVIFSGTDNQVSKIFQSNKDGLVSRFLVIKANGRIGWRDGFAGDNNFSLDAHFDELSSNFYDIWKYFKQRNVKVSFTNKQQNECKKFGSAVLAYTEAFIGEYAASLPKRHVGMLLRIASTLCLVRQYEKEEVETEVLCTDSDFYTALFIIKTSIKNSIQLFNRLPGENTGEEYARKNKLWQLLPDDFTTPIVNQICSTLNISERTSYRYLKDFVSSGLLRRHAAGVFSKTTSGSDVSDGGGTGRDGTKTNYEPNFN